MLWHDINDFCKEYEYILKIAGVIVGAGLSCISALLILHFQRKESNKEMDFKYTKQKMLDFLVDLLRELEGNGIKVHKDSKELKNISENIIGCFPRLSERIMIGRLFGKIHDENDLVLYSFVFVFFKETNKNIKLFGKQCLKYGYINKCYNNKIKVDFEDDYSCIRVKFHKYNYEIKNWKDNSNDLRDFISCSCLK